MPWFLQHSNIRIYFDDKLHYSDYQKYQNWIQCIELRKSIKHFQHHKSCRTESVKQDPTIFLYVTIICSSMGLFSSFTPTPMSIGAPALSSFVLSSFCAFLCPLVVLETSIHKANPVRALTICGKAMG